MEEINGATPKASNESGRVLFCNELEDGIQQIIKDVNLTRQTCPLHKLKDVREALTEMLKTPVKGQSATQRIMEIRTGLESLMIVIDGLMRMSKSKQLNSLRTSMVLWIKRIDAEL